MHPSNLLILHNNEIGTFCIDCTDTPVPGFQTVGISRGLEIHDPTIPQSHGYFDLSRSGPWDTGGQSGGAHRPATHSEALGPRPQGAGRGAETRRASRWGNRGTLSGEPAGQ